jgi:hypothetical protein
VKSLIIPIHRRCEKYGRGYCSLSCDEKKPLSVFQNSSPYFQNIFHKNMTKTRKNGILKNSAQRWIQFSQFLIPVKKLREVIEFHPVLEKNLSQFFKIPSGFPGNIL